MSKRVIASKFLPTRPIGVWPWVSLILALDYWGASSLWWGLIVGAFGLLTLSTWHAMLSESQSHPSELPK